MKIGYHLCLTIHVSGSWQIYIKSREEKKKKTALEDSNISGITHDKFTIKQSVRLDRYANTQSGDGQECKFGEKNLMTNVAEGIIDNVCSLC